MCAIFVGSVHNFGKSDKYLFPIDALMVLMPNLIKKSWTVSRDHPYIPYITSAKRLGGCFGISISNINTISTFRVSNNIFVEAVLPNLDV